VKLASSAPATEHRIAPLVEEMLALRERFREQKQWQDADAIRDILQRGGIIVDDTEAGPRWRSGS
jgi:cysteinyl-tRNA synthetase